MCDAEQVHYAMLAAVLASSAPLVACRGREQLRATADDAATVLRDATAETNDAVDVAPTDVRMTMYRTLLFVAHAGDPTATPTTLPGEYLPGRYKEVARWKIAPYRGDVVRHTLPDGTTFEFDSNRRAVSGRPWSGATWMQELATLQFESRHYVPMCLGPGSAFTETSGAYRIVITCDTEYVPNAPPLSASEAAKG